MKSLFVYIIGLGLFFVSCATKSSKTLADSTSSVPASSTQNLAGADTDDHGCKASAGYTWSVALKDCIRTFETGVKMNSVEKTKSDLAAFIVFSKDSTVTELFLPERDVNALLQRIHPVNEPNKWVWSSDSASKGLKVYQNKDNCWVIEQDGKIMYQQVRH